MDLKSFSYESMGTKWEITVWDPVEDAVLEEIRKEVVSLSDDFDRTYSRFIKTSLVWKIAEKAGVYEVPSDFIKMLKWYIDFYELSGKKLNPLIGFTISDLGYDAEYSLIPKENIRPTPDLLETVSIVDESHIKTAESVLFDFGALGKGYFVDKITDLLKKKGFGYFMVNGSGDIHYVGPAPLRVGLEHPDDKSKVIGAIDMAEGAMCASGTNRRTWDKHHHVIDPATSSSVEGMTASWVIAENAVLADALASCLFFAPPENFKDYKFEYCLMNAEQKVKRSEGFNAELF